MNRSKDILIFVEDPGAVNFVTPLIAALKREHLRIVIVAEGLAKDYLNRSNIAFESVDSSVSVHQILDKEQPKLILIGTSENPDSLGLKLIEATRNRGIKSIGLIDARMNAPYRFRGRTEDSLTYAPDYLFVPDDWTKDAFYEIGYPREKIMVTGHPHYDYVLEVGRRLSKEDQVSALRKQIFPAAGNEQKIITFISEGSLRTYHRHAQNIDVKYNFTGWGLSTGRTEIIVEELLDSVKIIRPRPYLVLRLHPKDLPDDFSQYADRIDYFSRKESPLEVVYASDLVVGMTSMLLCEAALMGKDALSIIPRSLEKSWLPSFYNLSIPFIESRKELLDKMENIAKEVPDIDSNNKYIATGATHNIIEKIKSIMVSG